MEDSTSNGKIMSFVHFHPGNKIYMFCEVANPAEYQESALQISQITNKTLLQHPCDRKLRKSATFTLYLTLSDDAAPYYPHHTKQD